MTKLFQKGVDNLDTNVAHLFKQCHSPATMLIPRAQKPMTTLTRHLLSRKLQFTPTQCEFEVPDDRHVFPFRALNHHGFMQCNKKLTTRLYRVSSVFLVARTPRVQVSRTHRGAYGTGTIAENDESTNLAAIFYNLEHFC
jgi:hypothetical protein